jgi:hypothetical protein
MGARLGVHSFAGQNYPRGNGDPSFYPTSSTLSPEEWEAIVNYFYKAAPDSLVEDRQPIHVGIDLFNVSFPEAGKDQPPPTTTYIEIDPGNHGIYAAQGVEQKLYSYNSKLHPVSAISTKQVVTDIAFKNLTDPGRRTAVMLNMGELRPTDVTHGSLQQIGIDQNLHITAGETLFDSLERPVNIQAADVDHDGKLDYVVCGYGNYSGSLFLLKNKAGHFEKVVLRGKPGSIQSIVTDTNQDGRPDIIALLAQGDEGVFLYEQQADGSFSERNLLRFSPSYGSISIELSDFNRDGFADILYTSGDNADYSKVLKPYHGLYVFLNDGHWNFSQKYFYHINGCFDAVARDFDLDGDVDIAAISFFADYQTRPEEGFVFLRNDGGWKFSASTVPEFGIGRWISMSAEDLDGDGDQDIVLGNLSIGPSNFKPKADWRNGPAFLVLKNKIK